MTLPPTRTTTFGPPMSASGPTASTAPRSGSSIRAARSSPFYPKPQRHADSPKIQVTRDGAVWYSPRGSREAPAFGVLYPDMDKIDSLGAFYTHGPPGYPFPVPSPDTTEGQ